MLPARMTSHPLPHPAAAVELGINYLDTAPLYGVGESERITGLALSGGFREKVTLATKCGDPMPDYVKGQKPYSRQGLLNSVEHSLKLLNTKTIDILLIHDPCVPPHSPLLTLSHLGFPSQ